MSTELLVAIITAIALIVVASLNGTVALLLSRNTHAVKVGATAAVETVKAIQEQKPEIEKIHTAVNSTATAAQEEIKALRKELDERRAEEIRKQEEDNRKLLAELAELRRAVADRNGRP